MCVQRNEITFSIIAKTSQAECSDIANARNVKSVVELRNYNIGAESAYSISTVVDTETPAGGSIQVLRLHSMFSMKRVPFALLSVNVFAWYPI